MSARLRASDRLPRPPLGNLLNADFNATREVTGLEPPGSEVSMMYFVMASVSIAFKTIAHFEPHSAFDRRHDQKHTVILILLADLPAPTSW